MKYRLPSTSALVAFESAARHCNFSRAAEELHTSQSAISRHIAELESRLGVSLFIRFKRKLSLSEQGEQYYHAVVASLDNINAITKTMSTAPKSDLLTIACTHEISHLFLMPRYDALQTALGKHIVIRIMTYEYETYNENSDPQVDIKFSYQRDKKNVKNSVPVLAESVMPICSPTFLQKNKSVLKSDISGWGKLPFLLNTRKNYGWATWQDWFIQNQVNLMPEYLSFYNYIYLLEAATAGRGLALGWQGLIERYLDSGALVPATEKYTNFDRALFAELTQQGQDREIAKRCQEYFNQEEN